MLSYGTQVWNPYLAKDIKTIQRVQRHCKKCIRDRNELDYKSRLLDPKAQYLQRHRTYTDRHADTQPAYIRSTTIRWCNCPM